MNRLRGVELTEEGGLTEARLGGCWIGHAATGGLLEERALLGAGGEARRDEVLGEDWGEEGEEGGSR